MPAVLFYQYAKKSPCRAFFYPILLYRAYHRRLAVSPVLRSTAAVNMPSVSRAVRAIQPTGAGIRASQGASIGWSQYTSPRDRNPQAREKGRHTRP